MPPIKNQCMVTNKLLYSYQKHMTVYVYRRDNYIHVDNGRQSTLYLTYHNTMKVHAKIISIYLQKALELSSESNSLSPRSDIISLSNPFS